MAGEIETLGVITPTHLVGHDSGGIAGRVAVASLPVSTATTAFVNSSKSAVRAHKNAVDQTITNNTVTLVTWSTEAFDSGNYFASNVYTPPSGPVFIDAAVTLTVTAASGVLYLYIYKNGGAIRRVRADMTIASTRTIQVSMADVANGTDAYDIRIFQSSGVDATLLGAISDSSFHGRAG